MITRLQPGRCIRRVLPIHGKPWVLWLRAGRAANDAGDMALAPLGTKYRTLRWRSFTGILRDAFAVEFAEQLTILLDKEAAHG